MVSRKTAKRKAVILLPVFIIVAFVAFVINAVIVSVNLSKEPGADTQESSVADSSADESSGNRGEGDEDDGEDDGEDDAPKTPVLLEKIDLQPVVNEWVSSVGGAKGVIIYDLNRSEVVGEYNADEEFATASLYKLFAVYEGYRRVERGEWDPEEAVGWYGDSIAECLDSAIRSSDSSCAEPIWAMIGHDELDEIVAGDYGISGADVSHLAATPRAVMLMMKRFYEHPDFTDEAMVARMWDSFLNQPVVNGYDWRQGLPSGFSEAALVYNKVGWQWSQEEDGSNGHWVVYDDAAIVKFPEVNRNLIVVVMTSNVRYQSIREFGAMIEAAILK
ncbi:hypothetical protein IJJ37_01070 [Candidatus Saccharibacteria bacterium]|nr:hypothetical protein [Candidatus Saccharibacteria bacterium]